MAGVDISAGGTAGAGENDVAQATSTAELTRMIRRTGEALDRAMAGPNADYFGAQMESLRNDSVELFGRLLVRNPYSSHRKDAVSKMWFRAFYPTIEQYRANIRQFEAMLAQGGSHSSTNGDNAQAGDAAAAMEVRRELSKWRARFQTFLQAAAGTLQRLVTELAEAHTLAALAGEHSAVLDHRTLTTHVYGIDVAAGLRSELHPALTPVQRAAAAIVARLLTHLGDLARYGVLHTGRKTSTDGADNTWRAAKGFYRSAVRMAPHRGQAYNQLAVLFGYERNSVEGVFAYYRALTAQYRFLPAEANLRTMLDGALRAVDASAPNAGDAVAGYMYYEQRMYAKYTHLRYLFAFHQPQTKDPASSLQQRVPQAPPLPRDEAPLAAEIRSASAAFVRGVTSGAIDERAAVIGQAILLFELQLLACLPPDVRESPRYDPRAARLSGVAVAAAVERLCVAVHGALSDSLPRLRGVKRECDLLSRAARRALPLLVPALLWLLSACVRVARDANSRDCLDGIHVTLLKAQVFVAVRESGLLDAIARLKQSMEDARSRIGQQVPSAAIAAALTWAQAQQSMDTVAVRLWAANYAPAKHTLRTEDDLLLGWQLPDGSVWGRVPSEPSASQESAAVPISGDIQWTRWQQLYCLLGLVHEALPQVLDIVDSSAEAQAAKAEAEFAQGVCSDDDDDDQEDTETICFQVRPSVPFQQSTSQKDSQRESVRSPSDTQSIPPTPEKQLAKQKQLQGGKDQVPAVPASVLSKLQQTVITDKEQMKESGVRRQAITPLVDTERDEVVNAANMRAQQPPRQAIGAQRTTVPSSVATSGPVATSSDAFYSMQTGLTQPSYGQSAISAWQQYQIEYQRKLALQQQLEQQHRIQQQLLHQLMATQQPQQQQQYYPMPDHQLYRGTTSMPYSANNPSSIYSQYSTLCTMATPTSTQYYPQQQQQQQAGPSLHPSLSMSSVGSGGFHPWMSPSQVAGNNNNVMKSADDSNEFGLLPPVIPSSVDRQSLVNGRKVNY
ncbi:hypothetical protein IWW36_003785 [Coemansia brasiliensis]|uniref:Telomerase activating protein Est1-like N-terminal domain-containing protein n=1 Tax=Coemansia brasiliensis TaxID=2650707 RepID=A0A9W8I731_9FUNG|nr:hypothetical protein IWW36_003785 [Coemansia brasiliensis]